MKVDFVVERSQRRHNLLSYMQTFKLFQLHRGNSKAAILFISFCIPSFLLSFFPSTSFFFSPPFFPLLFALRHSSHKWGEEEGFPVFSVANDIALQIEISLLMWFLYHNFQYCISRKFYLLSHSRHLYFKMFSSKFLILLTNHKGWRKCN